MESFKEDIGHINIDSNQYSKAKGLYLSLTLLPPPTETNFQMNQNQLFEKIFESLKKTEYPGTEMEVVLTSKPNPSVRDYVSRLLKLVLLHNDSLSQLRTFIFDRTTLITEDSVVKHGEYFVMTYKNVVMEFICRNVRVFVEHIFHLGSSETFYDDLKFICDLCEFAQKKISPEYGKPIKAQLVRVIMERLSELLNSAKDIVDNEIHVINMLSHVMMIFEGEPLYKMDQNQLIYNWFIKVMSDAASLLDVKTKALILLPCFTGFESTCESQKKLDTCLQDNLQEKHFPLQSNEFKQGSIKGDSYIACYQAVLEALVASRSPVVLMFVIKTSAADPKHVIEHELRTAIEKYAKSQEEEVLLRDLEMIYGIFFQRKYTHEIRLTVLRRFLLGILKTSHETVLKRFFHKFYKNIMKRLSENKQKSETHSLVDKIGCYQLLEILFGVLTKEYLKTPESPVHDPERKALHRLLSFLPVATNSIILIP